VRMMVLKSSLTAVVLTVAVSASAFAQAAQPPAGAPKPQAPATPPAATPPAAPKAPPVPFPQDSKIAFIDINVIAASSVAGKEAAKKLEALQTKKSAELQEKSKQLQALQTKLQTGGTVLNDAARGALEKDIDRLQRDIQFNQQNAQAEFNDLTNELQTEFQKKLLPIIEEVAKEKGLYAVFSIADAGAAYVHAGLNISDEIVKRLDIKK
jgi:Skp family chaperone for outer membrane proteins